MGKETPILHPFYKQGFKDGEQAGEAKGRRLERRWMQSLASKEGYWEPKWDCYVVPVRLLKTQLAARSKRGRRKVT